MPKAFQHYALIEVWAPINRSKDVFVLRLDSWNATNGAVYFFKDRKAFSSRQDAKKALKKSKKNDHVVIIRNWRYVMTAEQLKQQLIRFLGDSLGLYPNIAPSSIFYLAETGIRFPRHYALGDFSGTRQRRIWLMLETS